MKEKMPQNFKRYDNHKLDGRVKLNPNLHDEIRQKYASGNHSWQSLANDYGVSKKLIGLIVNEQMAERQHEYIKGRWTIYYSKEKQRVAMKKYRDKKRKLKIGVK